MFYSIDRFEGNYAVLISDEDGSQIIADRSCIPCEAGEGSVLVLSGGQYAYDREETEKRRRDFFLRIKNLRKK
ncbi:MAG: DUF3006 domain-containing protein [Oscillospiraceae bacterium]|nr:DUF3006 domain-containing protein [Oscillospiraceae bacterium]